MSLSTVADAGRNLAAQSRPREATGAWSAATAMGDDGSNRNSLQEDAANTGVKDERNN